jgi:hypothetical protein
MTNVQRDGRGLWVWISDEELSVVYDALVEHRQSNQVRHRTAVRRGDTVSTTDERIALAGAVLDRLAVVPA